MLHSIAWTLAILIPFALALESAEQAELSNKKTNHTYGYAIYGFWGAVVLFGILRNLLQQVQIRSTSSTRSDVEDFGSADLHRPLSIDKAGYWSRTYFTTPSALGTYRARPLFWCTIPTRIEAIVIVAYWILSIVLCGVGYVYYTGKSAEESLLGSSLTIQQWNNFGNRCAVLALSNLPVLWIFAGRNSVFLWATGWSFQTFNIFHRHIARVVILLSIGHASAHTHVALITQLPTGHSLYQEGLKLDWFVWGIVAATSMGIFWLTSMSWLRRKSYEVFLLIHIGLGIVVIYSVFRHTTRAGGAYNGYLWALVAIWSSDRLLRIVRLFACNLKLGRNNNSLQIVSTVAEYHPKSDVIKVRVQTSGLGAFKPSPGQHCFLYQPLSLRFWESHPFTVGSWSSDSSLSTQTSEQILSPSPAAEKDCRIDSIASTLSSNTSGLLSPRERSNAVSPNDTDVLTFWIRPYDGWTRRLRDQCAKSQSGTCQPRLLTEGPYGHSARLYRFDTVVFIAGGTGVSAVLPYIKDHVYRSCNGTSRITDMRLAWASRKASFVQSVCSEELSSVLLRSDFKMDAFLTDEPHQASQTSPQSTSQPSSPSSAEENKPSVFDLNLGPLSGVDYQSGRPNLATIIDTAVRELRAGGQCAVFVCGPASMADDARAAAHAAMKAGACRLEYFEDSFGW